MEETHRPCARGEKKNCAPSRNLSQTESTHRRASIANHPNAHSNPFKLHRRAKNPKTTLACDRYLPPIYARTTFFSSTKSALNAEKNSTKPETARIRPNAKNALKRKPRDISLRSEPNGEKEREREEMREHLQFTHHFCLSKIFFPFCFLLRVKSVKKCSKSERER